MKTTSERSISAECHADLSKLHTDFFRGLDLSLLEQNGKSIVSNPTAWDDRLIGEGADCCAFLTLKRQYVLTLPKPEFYERRLVLEWTKRLEQLSTLGQVPLLPPLKVLRFEHQVAVVTPYGEKGPESAAERWQPLATWIAYTENYLLRHGLRVDDTMQIRVRSGVPFMIDFSDLRLA